MDHDLWPSPYPTGQFGGFADTTTITVTMRYAPLSFLLGLFTPVLAIDGQPVPAGWRRTVVTSVTPGRHHVHAHVPYLLPRRIGTADLVVDAHPGETVELDYRAPLIVFLRGALGAGPQKYPGLVPTVILLVLTLLLGALVFGAAAVATRSLTPPPAAPVSRTVPPLPDLPATPPSLTEEPALREGLPARRVKGAVFGDRDDTSTMRIAGWPFAFRVPAPWNCAEATVELPGAHAYICGGPQSGTRLALMLRACQAPCAAADRNAMNKTWFRAGEKPRRLDANTRFVEDKRRYQLVVSHFFGADQRWQIALDATSPVKTRGETQKVVNDIVTQTSVS